MLATTKQHNENPKSILLVMNSLCERNKALARRDIHLSASAIVNRHWRRAHRQAAAIGKRRLEERRRNTTKAVSTPKEREKKSRMNINSHKSCLFSKKGYKSR